jgi:hypothetical protein
MAAATTTTTARRTTTVEQITPLRIVGGSARSHTPHSSATAGSKRAFGASPSPYKAPRQLLQVRTPARNGSASAVTPAANASRRAALCNLAERAALQRVSLSELAEREPRFGAPAPDDVASIGWQTGAAFVFNRERLGESFAIAPVSQSVMQQRLLQLGADASQLSDVWLDHHYGMVVWKLAALERAFPRTLGGRWLTATRVLEQLCYRYEREMNRAHRSVLRKLLERDASPQSHMVLFVATVLDARADAAVVVLCDGWHVMRAKFDAVLSSLLGAGRIAVGDKLRVCGAALSDGDAVAPFEDAAVPTSAMAVTLQLHYNGTRRAPWTAKLGAQRDALFRVSLKSLRVGSGAVPFIDVCVQRVYPMRYRENTERGAVWRAEADERVAEREHERARERVLEQQALKWQATTAASGEGANEFQDNDAARMASGPQRDVSSCFRVRVSERGGGAECFLSLYRMDELRANVREGEHYRVFGFVASKSAIDGRVHLTSANRARLLRLAPPGGDVADFRPRVCTSLAALAPSAPLRTAHDVACVVVSLNTTALGGGSVLVAAPSASDAGEPGLAVLHFGSVHMRLFGQLRVGTLLHVLDATLVGWRHSPSHGAVMAYLTLDLDADVVAVELSKASSATRCHAALREAVGAAAEWALRSASFGVSVEHASSVAQSVVPFRGSAAAAERSAPPSPPPSPPPTARSSTTQEQPLSVDNASQLGAGMVRRRAALTAHVSAGGEYAGSFALPSGRSKVLVEAMATQRDDAAMPICAVIVDATRVGTSSNSSCMLEEQKCFFHLRNPARTLDSTVSPLLRVVMTFCDGKHQWNAVLNETQLRGALESALGESAPSTALSAARTALEDAVRLTTVADMIADEDDEPALGSVKCSSQSSAASASAQMAPALKRRITKAARRYRERMLADEALLPEDGTCRALAERAVELARRAIWLRWSVLRDLFERDDDSGGDAVAQAIADDEALDALLAGCEECDVCMALGLERRVLLCDDEWQALFRAIVCVLACRSWRVVCAAAEPLLTPTGATVEVWPIATLN